MSKFSVDRFMTACSGTDSIKLHVEQRGVPGGTVYSFPHPYVLIGSHERADLRLSHPEVSQRQVYLQLIEGRLFGVHLSNRVPTSFGDQALRSGWVDEQLTFGPFTIRSLAGPSFGTKTPAVANPMAAGSFSGQRYVLELVKRQSPTEESGRGTLDRVLALVGHEDVCRVRIRSPHLSSIHCSLVLTEAGLWGVDLCGRGGIRVNGIATRSALLEEGDVFEVGGHTFRIHLDLQSSRETLALPAGNVLLDESQMLSPAPSQLPVAPTSEHLAERGREIDCVGSDEATQMLLARFEDFHNQTVEQFQDVLMGMMQMMGNLFDEQRQFVRGEAERFERVIQMLAAQQPMQAAATAALPQAAVAKEKSPVAPAATPGAMVPPPAPVDHAVHMWLQQRIQDLGDKRASMWQKFTQLLRGAPSVDPKH